VRFFIVHVLQVIIYRIVNYLLENRFTLCSHIIPEL
jgi:hypothetical protein